MSQDSLSSRSSSCSDISISEEIVLVNYISELSQDLGYQLSQTLSETWDSQK